jgi:hypothetical protein
MDGVNTADENIGPTGAANLVRETSLLLSAALVSVDDAADGRRSLSSRQNHFVLENLYNT